MPRTVPGTGTNGSPYSLPLSPLPLPYRSAAWGSWRSQCCDSRPQRWQRPWTPSRPACTGGDGGTRSPWEEGEREGERRCGWAAPYPNRVAQALCLGRSMQCGLQNTHMAAICWQLCLAVPQTRLLNKGPRHSHGDATRVWCSGFETHGLLSLGSRLQNLAEGSWPWQSQLQSF